MSKAVAVVEKAHAEFSASGSDRWLNCQGSIREEAKYPPSKSGPSALRGTDAHYVLDFLIKNRKKRKAAVQFLLKKYPADMVAHGEDALDYLLGRLKELGDGVELHSEIRADLPVSYEGQFGTSDAVIIEHFGKLIVTDYKFGVQSVHPKENSQLIYYALAIAALYDYNFSEVELIIIQPNDFKSKEKIKTWTTTVDRLLEWKDIFEEGIKNAKRPNAPLKSGKWCQFCRAQIDCKEFKNKALRDCQTDFDDDTGELKLPQHDAIFPNLSKVLPALDRLEMWIASVRGFAEMRLREGHKIKGYEMVPTRPSRVWKDVKQAEAMILKKFGNKMTWFAPIQLLSPAQFEKLGPKHKEFVAAYAQSVSSGLKLGESKAADDFDDQVEGGRIVHLKTGKKKQRKVK